MGLITLLLVNVKISVNSHTYACLSSMQFGHQSPDESGNCSE